MSFIVVLCDCVFRTENKTRDGFETLEECG